MRTLVVSDIHGNLTALEAVLSDADTRGPIDAVWNAGDTVGYGPQPLACVERLRSLGAIWVAGNHEQAATGAISGADFNPAARAAVEWTGDQLPDDAKAFLDALPEVITEGDFVIVHGTLRWPIWEYLFEPEEALAHLTLMTVPYSIVGHTHIPMVVRENPDSGQGCSLARLLDGVPVPLGSPRKSVFNPGSVGQPRDGDPRASYAICDSDAATFTVHRVEYDIETTQKEIIEAGLPEWLADRLAIGR